MREPFVAASRARGVTDAQALIRHAWPASLRPVLGLYGVMIGSLFSGSFVVEVVTSWPGLGRLMFDALKARDLYLVAGCAASGAVFLAAGTLIADVLLAIADPRVRVEGALVTRRAALFVLALDRRSRWPRRCWRRTSRAARFATTCTRRRCGREPVGPVVHPLVLVDRLEQRYEADPTRTVPLPWFGGMRRCAGVPARRRQLRPRRAVAPALRRAHLDRPRAVRHARRRR